MKARMGAVRTVGLATVTAMVAAGLGAVAMPSSYAAPSFPAPASPRWVGVAKAAAPITDEAGDIATTHLDLTASGGALGPATAFVSAELQHLYFRMHVSASPAADAAGGYVVQLDANGNLAGWERAIRYDTGADTITNFAVGVTCYAVKSPKIEVR